MFRKSKGFGLLQTLIAVGLMSVIGLGMTSMIVGMVTSQKNAQNKNDLLTKFQEIDHIISHKDICQAALRRPGGGKLAANATGKFDYPLESIVYETKDSVQPVISVGQVQDGVRFKSINIKGEKLAAGIIRLKDSAGNAIVAEKWLMTLRIEAAKAEGALAAGPDSYRAKETSLIGLFDQTSKAIVGCYEKTNEDYICENLFDGTYDDTQMPRCRLNSIGLSNRLGPNPGGIPSVDFMIGGETDDDHDGNYDEETIVIRKVDAGPPFGIVRRFGIGTRDPHTRLHVANGVARFEGGIEGFTYLDIGNYASMGKLYVKKGTSPMGEATTGELLVDGDAKFNGRAAFGQDVTAKTFLASSDRRLKENIQDIPDKKSKKIFELEPKSFRYRNDDSRKTQYGLIAQEVRKLFPELVVEGEDGLLAVDYQSLSLLLLQETQKMRKELSELKKTSQGKRP